MDPQSRLRLELDLNNTALHPSKVRGPFTIGLDVRPPYGVDGSQIEEVIRAYTLRP